MGDRTFANGLYYFFEAYPFAVTASLIPPALGVLVLLGGWRRAVAPLHLVLGVGGLLHAGTYLLLDTAPYQWYYGPAIGALTMLGAVGAPRAALRTGALGAVGGDGGGHRGLPRRPPLDAHDDLRQLGHAHRVPRAGRARARGRGGAVVRRGGHGGLLLHLHGDRPPLRPRLVRRDPGPAGGGGRAVRAGAAGPQLPQLPPGPAAHPAVRVHVHARPDAACPRPPGAATRGRWWSCRVRSAGGGRSAGARAAARSSRTAAARAPTPAPCGCARRRPPPRRPPRAWSTAARA